MRGRAISQWRHDGKTLLAGAAHEGHAGFAFQKGRSFYQGSLAEARQPFYDTEGPWPSGQRCQSVEQVSISECHSCLAVLFESGELPDKLPGSFILSKAMKYLLMHECQCWPIWSDAGENLHPCSLPLSASLSEKMMKWSDLIDEILPLVENPSADYESNEQKVEVMKQGRTLAIELQKELGPSHEVEFRFYSEGQVQSWNPSSEP